MRVVGMDDAAAIGSGRVGRRVDAFDSAEIERDENHIEPDGRQHQRPERHRPLLAFDCRGETEMPGDHRPAAPGRGQGGPESTMPTTTMKRIRPTMNAMAGKLACQ